jgi:zinc protease
MAPGSIYGQRITIGTEETINGVKEKDFRDYYNKWYVASNATVIVLADTDPQIVVKAINESFSSLPTKPKPTSQDVGIKPYEKSFAIVTSDPELRSAEVRIMRIEKGRPPVTTVPQMRAELVEQIGSSAFNRRMGDKVAKGGTSYQNISASTGTDSRVIYTAEVSARAPGEKWKDALKDMALELRRAQVFGFTQREIDDVNKELISGAERAVETESTVPAQQMIARINNDLAAGEPTMSASQRVEFFKKLLPSITPEEVAKQFATDTDTKTVAFVAVLPSNADVPTEAQLLELGTAALKVEPSKDIEEARKTELLSTLPAPGKVAEGTLNEPTKVWSGRLSNNALVNYRFMDERKNEVSINISLIGGEVLETASNRGITRAAELAWSRSATQHLSSTDIREIMNGKKVSVRGGGGFGGGRGGGGGRRGGGGGGGAGDSISLNISGSPAELETGFQLAYLLLTEPKIEAGAFEQFQTMSKQMLQESAKNPMMYGMRLVAQAPYPESEVRVRTMTMEQVDALSMPAAQAWIEKLIKESPIEVTIVGDIAQKDALDLAAKYIGALPARDKPSPKSFENLRHIARPKGPRIIEETVDSPTPQAFVTSGFYGCDETNLADVRTLNMAARILSTRMIKEVREEAQLVYSIGAASRAGSTYPGFGVFSAGAPTDPAKVPALVEKLSSMYEAFAKDGPTAEELDTAKKQMQTTFDEQMKEPTYWSGRLQGIALRGTTLDEIAQAPAAYQTITAEQVKATFNKYYSKDNAIVVVVKPK